MEEEKVEKKKKKPVDEAKRKQAVDKVNKLLEDTSFSNAVKEEENKVFTPPVEDSGFLQPAVNDQATTWLNEQVTALTVQVENYEKELRRLSAENQNLINILNSGGQNTHTEVSGGISEAKIVELYKQFEGVYTGRKFNGQRFATAQLSYPQSGSGVLDMFLATFPFLQNVREYKHWG